MSAHRIFFLGSIVILFTANVFGQFSFNQVTGPQAGFRVLRADANGDGNPDVIGYDSQIRVLLNDGHGNLHFAASAPPVNWISTLHPADLNRNGHIDLAGCYQTSYDAPRGLGLWYNDGSGHFALGSSPSIPGECNDVAAGDFNGDGLLDLAVGWTVNPRSDFYNGISVFFGRSSGGFSAPVVTDHFTMMSESGACSTARMVTADHDRDGRADLVIATSCPGFDSSDSIMVYAHGDGAGHFGFSNITEASRDFYPQRDDVDQDGIIDIPFYDDGSGPHASSAYDFGWVRNTNGANPPSWSDKYVYGAGTYAGEGNTLAEGVFGDFDGDGRKDAAINEAAVSECGCNPTSQSLDLFKQQSDGTFAGPQKIDLSSAGGQILSADFNRDGRIDVAFESGSNTLVMLNTTPGAPGCSADPNVRSLKICIPSRLTGNSLHLFANTTDSDNITGMRAYVDNTFRFYSPNDLMNKYITVPNGGHRITITAWDARGSFSSTRWTNVNTAFGCSTLSTNRSINFCFPTGHATVGSPTQVVAAVRTSYSYGGAKVFIDGAAKYSTTSKQVNANLSLSPGSHRITVQGRDSQGMFTKTVNVTVR